MLAAGRHEAQVIRGLSRALQQQTSQQLQQLRGRRVVVTPDRVCEVSSKPVGDRVFVVYPNSTLVLFTFAKNLAAKSGEILSWIHRSFFLFKKKKR